jgi:hypothetical protein
VPEPALLLENIEPVDELASALVIDAVVEPAVKADEGSWIITVPIVPEPTGGRDKVDGVAPV